MGLQLKPAAGDGDPWVLFPDDSLLSASPELCGTARSSLLGYTDSDNKWRKINFSLLCPGCLDTLGCAGSARWLNGLLCAVSPAVLGGWD